jgi:hypothetical protein
VNASGTHWTGSAGDDSGIKALPLAIGRTPTQLSVDAVTCAAVPDGLQEAVWPPPVQRNQVNYEDATAK